MHITVEILFQDHPKIKQNDDIKMKHRKRVHNVEWVCVLEMVSKKATL